MIKFISTFFPNTQKSTFLQSCGISDVVASCYAGRGRMIAEAFVTSEKSMSELEEIMMDGQQLQGPASAAAVNKMLKNNGLEDSFPLFTAVHRICTGQMSPDGLIDSLRHHPEHMGE